jgi:hypothetical protein
MTEERFSLRYGYEVKPENPIFDEAPKRLRFLILRSFQKYFYTHQVPGIIGEALCHAELITKGFSREKIWGELYPYIEKAAGWEIYNLIERMYVEAQKGQHSQDKQFEDDINRLFGEEGIGWKLRGGKLERTLPEAALEQVDAAFKELGNPRFAPALAQIIAAYKAYNARPQRGLDVCSNAFDGWESVAKEVFGLPTATLGDVLKEARSRKSFASETITTLEKLSTLAHNHFRHGMTEPFALGPSEVDFVYMTCLAGILLFVRMH